MVDLNDVALFVQVVQCGSFAEAGRRLGMPSNTLSRRIGNLEDRLGTRLLQRSTRKLSLTDAGRRYFERCGPAVGELEQAADELVASSGETRGVVRIAAPADFFTLFRMQWTAEFLKRYPAVRLQFVLDDAHADLIADGIDVAIRGGMLSDSSLIARKLISMDLGLVASPAYLESRGVPETIEALAEHDCVLGPSARPRWTLDTPDGTVEIDVSGPFSANTLQALVDATLQGLGIALLPSGRVADDIEAGRLKAVLPQVHRSGGGLYALFPSRLQLLPAVLAFVDFVVEKLPEMPAAIPRRPDAQP